MSSLSRNSCAKAFGNWSRAKNFRLKNPRGVSTNPPPASLKVDLIGSYMRVFTVGYAITQPVAILVAGFGLIMKVRN